VPKITRRQRSSSRIKLADSRAQLIENLQILQKQQQTQQMLSNLSKIRSFSPSNKLKAAPAKAYNRKLAPFDDYLE
jgi:hypothetical protein